MDKNMLEAFIDQNYLIVEANIVTTVVVWNGDTTVWTPPEGSIALVQATTPAMVWQAVVDPDTKKIIDYTLVEVLGVGSIGFTWDGTVLTTNQPKPVVPDTPV